MKKFHGDIQTEAQLLARWKALGLPASLKGKRVLDIGAAEGWFSCKCVEAGASVYAIEPVRELKGRMGSVLEVTRAYIDGNSVALPSCVFGSGIDIVLMLRVLYHTRIPQLVLARAATALKPGGALYIENWFDDPTDSRKVMRMYIDEPDGWRFVPTRECLYDMLIKYGFAAPECIFKYQENHRQIWRTIKS